MSNVLAPAWGVLFEKFGIFGLFIVLLIPTAITLALVLLILGVVRIIKKKTTPPVQQPVAPPRPTPAPAPAPVARPVPKVSEAEQLYRKGYALMRQGMCNTGAALPYFREAAAAEHSGAQYMLGRLYCCGLLEFRDMNRGIRWFHCAAKNGNLSAHYELGRIYGENKKYYDVEQAILWLQKPAGNDNVDAQYLLSRMYSKKMEDIKKQRGYTTREQWLADEEYMACYDASDRWLKAAALGGCEEAQALYF